MKNKFVPLSNLYFIDHYNNNEVFGGVFSRDNLPTLKISFISLNKTHESGSHWMAAISFDKFIILIAVQFLHHQRLKDYAE